MAPGVRRARGGRGRQKRQTWGEACYAVWSDPLPVDLAAFVVTLCVSAVFTAATAVLHTAAAAGLRGTALFDNSLPHRPRTHKYYYYYYDYYAYYVYAYAYHYHYYYYYHH